MNGTLLMYECRLRGGNTLRLWGHSNPTCYDIIYLNFFHLEAVKMEKYPTLALGPTRAHLCRFMPICDYTHPCVWTAPTPC